MSSVHTEGLAASGSISSVICTSLRAAAVTGPRAATWSDYGSWMQFGLLKSPGAGPRSQRNCLKLAEGFCQFLGVNVCFVWSVRLFLSESPALEADAVGSRQLPSTNCPSFLSSFSVVKKMFSEALKSSPGCQHHSSFGARPETCKCSTLMRLLAVGMASAVLQGEGRGSRVWLW